jgi:hypothetical protein
MTISTTPLRRTICILALAACAVLLSAVTSAAVADDQKKPANPAKPDPVDFEVIPLKHSTAHEVSQVLQNLFAPKPGQVPVRIVADARTNTVVVSASATVIAEIRSVIQKVDAPGPEQDAQAQLRIFALRALEPDKTLEETLAMALRRSPTNNFTLDKVRRLVIVTGDREMMKVAEALIARLEDSAVRPAPAEDVQVRVVWLASGPVQGAGAPLPDDLKEVAPALAKVGLGEPRLVAQTLVSARPNASFQTMGMTKLDAPHQFFVSGHLSDRKEGPGLSLTIRVMRLRDKAPDDICNLQAEVSAPPGHFVVLGVTPTDTVTSAFVVQLLRSEAGKGRK